MADNNNANVSTAKGVKGGYFFSASTSSDNLEKVKSGALKDFSQKVTDILTDARNLGFVSQDGWKTSEERTVDTYTDVNGETVDSSTSAYLEKIAATLIEKSADSLKEMYGDENVNVDDGVIEVLHTSDDKEMRIYVADLILKNGRRWRYIVPMGQITELGEESIAKNALTGRQVTITGYSFLYKEGKTTTSIDYLEEVGAAVESSSSSSSEG